MPVPHVYDKISHFERPRGCWIYLKDGAYFGLPPSANQHYDKLKEGDTVLIDLEQWETKKAIAYVWVFRDGREVVRFGIGHDCQLTLPRSAQ